MTRVIPSEPSASEHAARYETLRNHAMERDGPAARHGLAVLLRQGMAAWMDAWSTLPAPPLRSARGDSPRPCPLPNESSAAVVHVLAAMALGHMQEVHA
jgi:hypothetical protein